MSKFVSTFLRINKALLLTFRTALCRHRYIVQPESTLPALRRDYTEARGPPRPEWYKHPAFLLALGLVAVASVVGLGRGSMLQQILEAHQVHSPLHIKPRYAGRSDLEKV